MDNLNLTWTYSEAQFEADTINPHLKTEAWCGHRFFAYDLINFIKPSLMVELGSHHGCSFFSFCQAVKDKSLSTKLFAIDTWQGDAYAGYYDESIYKQFLYICNTLFSTLAISPLKMYFKEALPYFKDDSIDILHIDGSHSYQDVKLDFEMWLPKLSEQGIILFHDIDPELKARQFGSPDFWNEIKTTNPHFEFLHSFGLGVLFPKGDKAYQNIKKTLLITGLSYYPLLDKYHRSRIEVNTLLNKLKIAETQLKPIRKIWKKTSSILPRKIKASLKNKLLKNLIC